MRFSGVNAATRGCRQYGVWQWQKAIKTHHHLHPARLEEEEKFICNLKRASRAGEGTTRYRKEMEFPLIRVCSRWEEAYFAGGARLEEEEPT